MLAMRIKSDKRKWWDDLKSKIGLSLLPTRRVESQATVITPASPSEDQGALNEPAPVRARKPRGLQRVDEFYVGQRVLHVKRQRTGIVVRIQDLSWYVRDFPESAARNGSRGFALEVKWDDRKRSIASANGAAWKPVPWEPAE